MSPAHCNNDIALPHAGLLAYFRQPKTPSSCDKSAQTSWAASAILTYAKYELPDEEAQSDFCNAGSTTNGDSDGLCRPVPRLYQSVFHSLCDFWTFVCVVALASSAVLLGLDMVLGHYGVGVGLTDCSMGRHSPPPPLAYELQFCLVSPNREAPGPQTWRLMSSTPHHDCTTELVTLLVSLSERGKLFSEDSIVFGEEQRLQLSGTRIGKLLGDDALLKHRDLGDNIAEEGVLSQSGRN